MTEQGVYTVRRTVTISASHRLDLAYDSPCTRRHGHNWRITVWCRGRDLDASGILVDFAAMKRLLVERLDHRDLNDVMPCAPTAENLARWCVETVPHAFAAEVEESEGSMARYEEVPGC